jgi:RNA polymerase sigma factor (sigma-70 family)
MTDGGQLLREYVEKGSESAFRELVSRYVNFVYGAALRMVGNDAHLAQDVSQTVFVDLARKARTLSSGVMIGGWLHRHTCYVAAHALRTERRRQLRERQAVEMNDSHDNTAANLALVTPILDQAINDLPAEDRSAVLLRFFEEQDFRSVGERLGTTEEAARKRVNRALDKLEASLRRQGVALSVGALATALTAQASAIAPVGLAASISSAALAGAATATSTSLTLLQIISMTKAKIAIVTALIVAGVSVPLVIQHNREVKLRQENEQLRAKETEATRLAAENARLQELVAKRAAASRPATNDQQTRELMKLRGEVGQLRQQAQAAGETAAAATKGQSESALSGLTANPEMRKLIRDQQKAGLGMMYKSFAKDLKLPTEKAEKFNDVLADGIMDSIDVLTTALKQGKSGAELNKLFEKQEAATHAKMSELLGPDDTKKYDDYSRDLLSTLTSEQFKSMMTGDKETKDRQAKELRKIMQEETQAALAGAGLGPNYQPLPMLNFRNIASEEEGERSVQLMNEIYTKAAARSASILSPEDLKKFSEFQNLALNNNRTALAMNRQLMSPAGKRP